jgi:hypothetical protein
MTAGSILRLLSGADIDEQETARPAQENSPARRSYFSQSMVRNRLIELVYRRSAGLLFAGTWGEVEQEGHPFSMPPEVRRSHEYFHDLRDSLQVSLNLLDKERSEISGLSGDHYRRRTRDLEALICSIDLSSQVIINMELPALEVRTRVVEELYNGECVNCELSSLLPDEVGIMEERERGQFIEALRALFFNDPYWASRAGQDELNGDSYVQVRTRAEQLGRRFQETIPLAPDQFREAVLRHVDQVMQEEIDEASAAGRIFAEREASLAELEEILPQEVPAELRPAVINYFLDMYLTEGGNSLRHADTHNALRLSQLVEDYRDLLIRSVNSEGITRIGEIRRKVRLTVSRIEESRRRILANRIWVEPSNRRWDRELDRREREPAFVEGLREVMRSSARRGL